LGERNSIATQNYSRLAKAHASQRLKVSGTEAMQEKKGLNHSYQHFPLETRKGSTEGICHTFPSFAIRMNRQPGGSRQAKSTKPEALIP
jgi:hypothetical protein